MRSYGQWCALAKALDAVGERWSLLVVRELLDGPRRYTDLLEGIPGISTDVLAGRLKDLGEHTDEVFRPAWLVVGLRALLRPDRAQGVTLDIDFEIGRGEVVRIRVDGG